MVAEKIHETLQKYILADGMELIYDFDRSEGPYFYDQITDKKYLDFFCFFSTVPLSYNHPEFNDKEYLEKLERASRVRVSNSDIYTSEYGDFVKTFADKVVRDYFQYNFFVDGGALAVENALKTAFDWKVKKNLKKGKGEIGTKCLHFQKAFHGRSGYTLSLTNTADPRKYQYFPKFDWPRVSSPMCKFPMEGSNLEDTMRREEQTINEINEAILKHPDEIACILIEPIQCEGGDNHFRPEFLRKLRHICDENEMLLIFDEVQTGGGTTGAWWSFERFGVVPDAVAWAKKLQTGGICFTNRIDDVEDNCFKLSSRINSTWGGNLIDMVRAEKIIKIVENNDILDNAKTLGEYFLDNLRDLAKANPEKMSNARGLGLLIGVDLPDAEQRDAMLGKLKENGLLMLPCGTHSIRARPMLDIKKTHVDEAISIIEKTIKEI